MKSGVKILDFEPDDTAAIEQAARLLREEFRDTGCTDWLTTEDARAEVMESFEPGRVSRIAVDDGGTVLGWIGAIPAYKGKVWELHPLVVRADSQGTGVGKALVEDLEGLARRAGVWTMWLGSDDENGRTSLGGRDLYPDPLSEAARIENLGGHPFEFYLAMGYRVVGVLPDANGFGKPDIFLAKRIRSPNR
jgi:aminoglycoside 6'-N-acetyltransferase I